ncbi:CPBP family intramembrane metalloprotease [Paenibacillus sp. MER TA 81-3]|uniref:CPBP family intramembrane glutamic endopeptidase n=1 Tax=Paenibacillus sp. MER TA 81-3 TaxID=2939573 RepID=UPI00203EE6D8|nr:CPBP family intramembrane glutamic endopeptidase [Paenibacillus sp. MER TA 81-3]MCM3338976.1 CPBP family intramembrane metalloprotease [Paenibacillus sp. MER TA 81-3]
MSFTHQAHHDAHNQAAPSYYITKPLLIASIVGFIVFLTVQVIIPLLQSEVSPEEGAQVSMITKTEAVDKAIQYMKQQSWRSELTLRSADPTVVYQTDSTLAGYISKERLTEAFQPWSRKAPYDRYQVLLSVVRGGRPDVLSIDVNMTSGQIIGFNFTGRPTTAADDSVVSRTLDYRAVAEQTIKQLGWSSSELNIQQESLNSKDEIRFTVPKAKVGGATLDFVVHFHNNDVVTAKPVWEVPLSYKTEELQQTATASSIYKIGYTWMSLLLSILALVACIRYRKLIRFRSGTIITLSIVSCGISLLHIWNLLPGLISLQLGVPAAQIRMEYALIVQGGITVLQGVVLYFSLLAGTRLWDQSKHRRLMPTWSSPEFGTVLPRAFWLGTVYAGLLLGVQTFIFAALETGFGAWSTTDASQSPLNLRLPALYPLLAWMAAISEEGVYRWFGTGLLQRWVRNPWIAGLIPTLIWAFGHVTYPIFPFYSRPVELLIMGFMFLYIMLRHGFWTALFAHLMLDNLLMSMSYLLGGTVSGSALGALYLILPVLIIYGLKNLHQRKVNMLPMS